MFIKDVILMLLNRTKEKGKQEFFMELFEKELSEIKIDVKDSRERLSRLEGSVNEIKHYVKGQ